MHLCNLKFIFKIESENLKYIKSTCIKVDLFLVSPCIFSLKSTDKRAMCGRRCILKTKHPLCYVHKCIHTLSICVSIPIPWYVKPPLHIQRNNMTVLYMSVCVWAPMCVKMTSSKHWTRFKHEGTSGVNQKRVTKTLYCICMRVCQILTLGY